MKKAIVPIILVLAIGFLAIKVSRQKATIKTKDIIIVHLKNEVTDISKSFRNLQIRHKNDSVFYSNQITELESGLDVAVQENQRLTHKFQVLKTSIESVKMRLVQKDNAIAGLNARVKYMTEAKSNTENETNRAIIAERLTTSKLDELRRNAAPVMEFILSSTYARENNEASQQIRPYLKAPSENTLVELFQNDNYSSLRKLVKKLGTNLSDTYEFSLRRGIDPSELSKTRLKDEIRRFLESDFTFIGTKLFNIDENKLTAIKMMTYERFEL